MYDYEEPKVADSGIKALSNLVAELADEELKLADLEAQIKEQKEVVRDIKCRRIPDLFNELGILGSITTSSGLTISVKPVVKASITKANHAKAMAWFQENNLDRLVKDQFTVKLTTKQKEEAARVREKLNEAGVAFENKQTVHPSTLAAFVRERDAAGDPVPEDILGVYRSQEAKIG